MGVCGLITKSINFDCDNPLQAGAEDELIIINRSDWLNAVISVNVTNNVTTEDHALILGQDSEASEEE